MMNQKTKMKILAVTIALATGFSPAYGAGNTDQQNANAKIKIKAKLQLTKTQDLLFPDAYAGDDVATILPSDAGAAQFSVAGQKSASYLVDFPSSSIFMTTGAGDTADKKIAVDGFVSSLPSNTGSLDASTGLQTFSVGANRAAISSTQEAADDYTGVFVVRVTYQ